MNIQITLTEEEAAALMVELDTWRNNVVSLMAKKMQAGDAEHASAIMGLNTLANAVQKAMLQHYQNIANPPRVVIS